MENQKPPKKIPKIKKPNAKGAVKGFLNQYLIEILYFSFLGLLLFISLKFFSKQEYSAKFYFYFQIAAFVIGIFHAWGFLRWVSWAEKYRGTKELIASFFFFILGAVLVYFSSSTSYLPSLPIQYAWVFLMFLVPWIFMLCFEFFIEIPDKYYKGWQYPYGKEVPVIEVIDPVKIKFYLAKQREDTEYAEFELNVPPKYKLGDFMHYFMHRYNYDKNPEHPIFFSKENKATDLYDWLFYSRGNSMNKKSVLDPSKTFSELALGNDSNVVLDRYFLDEPSISAESEVIENSQTETTENNE